MKLLLLVLLVGLASARFVDVQHRPIQTKEIDVDETVEKLKEILDQILQQIKDKLDEGHYNIVELVKKAVEIIKKLKELHANLSDKAKELLDKIKEHLGGFWNKILEILGLKGRVSVQRLDLESLLELLNLGEIINKIKEMLAEHVDLDKIKEYINQALPKLQKIREAFLEAIEKGGVEGLKHFIEKIKEIFGNHRSAQRIDEDDIEALREILDQILQQIKDKLDEGHYNILGLLEKAVAVMNKLKELGASLGDKAKEIINNIKEHFGSWWNTLMEILGLNKRHGDESRDLMALYQFMKIASGNRLVRIDEDDVEKIKEMLANILQQIKDMLDKGHYNILELLKKAVQLINRLKELHADWGEKIKELMNSIKEYFGPFWSKLLEILGLARRHELVRARRALRDETVDKIKEYLDNLLQQIKDMLDQGHYNFMELLKKAIEAIQKLKDLHAEMGDKAKELLNQIKEHFGPFWSKLLELLGLGRRHHDARLDLEAILEFLKLKEIVEKIKEMLENHESLQVIKDFINEKLVKLTKIKEALLEAIEKGGVEGLKHFIGKLFEILTGQQRGIKELWDKITNFFNDLGLNIKDKFSNFSKFVLKHWNTAMDHAKDKVEKIKLIAEEFIEHNKQLSKEVIDEALEFFEPYKQELGQIWKEIVDIVNGRDKLKLH